MRRELFALSVIVFILVVFPATLLGYQAARSSLPGVRTIDIEARLPDEGGFVPDVIRLNRGERVRLRLSAPDVVHGFEIPGLGISAPDIYPGHVVEVTFTPEQVGVFTFACTRWCSVGHWRMRGVIEVVDPDDPGAMARLPTSEPPLYQQLGLDIDAMHELDPQVEESLHQLAGLPSPTRGEALQVNLPPALGERDWLRSRTPAEAFLLLRDDEAYGALSDAQLWDIVAFAWQDATTEAMLARGAELYARDCAACHGEEGRGDGVMGRDLPGLQAMMPDMERGPTDFTDLHHLAAVSDARLQGKLLRGGMGTGMPEFGSLYSTDDQWAVIAFVRTFAMNGERPTTND